MSINAVAVKGGYFCFIIFKSFYYNFVHSHEKESENDT